MKYYLRHNSPTQLVGTYNGTTLQLPPNVDTLCDSKEQADAIKADLDATLVNHKIEVVEAEDGLP